MSRGRWHRNLNATTRAHAWSGYFGPSKNVQHAETVVLRDVEIKAPSGKKWEALREAVANGDKGRRAVFTWWWAESFTVNSASFDIPENAERVRFNPRKDEGFHIDGNPVTHLRMAWLDSDGSAWGVRS